MEAASRLRSGRARGRERASGPAASLYRSSRTLSESGRGRRKGRIARERREREGELELGWRSCWHCSLSHCRRHRWRTRTFYQHHWRGEKSGVEKAVGGSGRTSLLERKHGVGKGLKVEVGGRTRETDGMKEEGGQRESADLASTSSPSASWTWPSRRPER